MRFVQLVTEHQFVGLSLFGGLITFFPLNTGVTVRWFRRYTPAPADAWRPTFTLQLTRRYRDFHVCPVGDEALWECAPTPEDAVGRWVMNRGRSVGMAVVRKPARP